jgi:hypothetical protein
MEQKHQDVVEVERGLWSADAGYFQKNLDDQSISVMGSMGFVTKDQAVDMSKSEGSGWTGVKMSDVHVVELNPDCVGLVYHAEAKNEKSGQPYRGTISSVYIRRPDGWKLGMTAHQPWPEEGSGSA